MLILLPPWELLVEMVVIAVLLMGGVFLALSKLPKDEEEKKDEAVFRK